MLADRVNLARAVRRLMRDGAVDIVEAPETGGWAVALPGRVPLVVRLHSPARFVAREHTGRRRGRLISLIEDLALRRADALVAVSRWVGERAPVDYHLAGLRDRQIRVIYNGVDVNRFSPRSWDERIPGRVVFAGTLKEQKGIVGLLKAFKQVAAKSPKAELIAAGRDTIQDGSSYFEAAVREAALDDEVVRRTRRLGAVPRESLPDLYASAAVCAFPSLGESFGLVAVEAMAVGRPVIYSRDTAGSEIIEDGVTGLLVDPRDAHALADAVLRILHDDDFAASLAMRGSKVVRERFSAERCAEETLDLYHRVLSAAGD